jgi:hypothetical protein
METKDDRARNEDYSTAEHRPADGLPGEANNNANLSRRRALIAALAAAPVVMSLMNRSAWGASASCNLVRSYANAGYRWQSPRPSNGSGTLTFTTGDYNSCGVPPPT